jgi:hypothetical protein
MVAFRTFPDAEAVAGKGIRSASTTLSSRVYSSVPKTLPAYPFAVVQRLGGVPAERHALDMAVIQVDVWGANKSQARTAAEEARRALHGLEGTVVTEPSAVVTGTEDATGLFWLPDPDTSRDRYTFSVNLYLYSTTTVAPFSPTDIEGLVAWYDFSNVATLWQDTARTSAITTDGQEILGVTDQSGNANHLDGGTTGPTYETNVKNGLSVGRGNGTDSSLVTSGIDTPQPVTILAVVAHSTGDVSSNRGFLSGENTRPYIFVPSTDVWSFYAGTAVNSAVAVGTSHHVITAKFNGASSVLYRDGTSIATGNPGTGGFDFDGDDRTRLFSSSGSAGTGGEYWAGDIGELLIFDTALSDTDRGALEDHLQEKWGTA